MNSRRSVSRSRTSCESRRGRLFVVSGPSGAGKTGLCAEVVQRTPHLIFSLSHTTRRPRTGEVDGRDYRFVSRAMFEQAIADGRMAEWAEVYNSHLYGTTRETIEQAGAAGDDIIFDIEQKGARQLCAAYPDVITILVLPPSLQVLRQRLVDRGTETGPGLEERLHRAEQEIESMHWYRYAFINDRFEDAVQRLERIIAAERGGCSGQPGLTRVDACIAEVLHARDRA